MSGGYATRRFVLVVAVLPAALWAACVAGRHPSGEAGSSARSALNRLGNRPTFRPHVEFAAGGAIDWGNLRLVVRVVLPLGRSEGPSPGGGGAPLGETARAHAQRIAATLAAGVRVDSRDTVAGLVPDAGALRRWTTAGMRPLGRRALPGGEIEEVYEVPLTGAGGIIDRLRGHASGRLFPLEEFSHRLRPGVVDSAAGALPETTGGRWGIDWSLRFFKGRAGGASGPAPVVIIDARGIGLAPALFPAVLDERGEPVYDAAAARGECVAREGLVQYIEVEPGTDLTSLADLPHMRPHVLVKAATAEGPLRANPVLTFRDARRLRAETAALREARVVVVLEAD